MLYGKKNMEQVLCYIVITVMTATITCTS